MSSKGTIQVAVEANTSKASSQLKQFKSSINSLNLSGIGKELGAGGGLGAEINSAAGMLSKFTSIISNPAVAGAGLIGTTIKGFKDIAERG